MKTLPFYCLLLLCLYLSPVRGQSGEPLYAYLFGLMNADHKLSFAEFGKEKSLVQRRVQPLEPEEGGKGYVVEPYLDYTFPILQKRVLRNVHVDPGKEINKDGMIRPLFGYTRVILNYNFHTKITKTRSSPILPPTNGFGIQLDRVLYIRSCTTDTTDAFWDGIRSAFKLEKTSQTCSTPDKLFFVYLSVLLKHYSNGQDGPELIPDYNRDNYRNGNFSTNYLYPRITACRISKKNWLYHLSLGYQREIGRSDGFLSLEKTQSDRRYGLNRARLNFQLRGNMNLYSTHSRFFRALNHFDWRFRSEFEYILDKDLSKYPYADKYRGGCHLFLELNHVDVRSLGVFVHFYRGRDPLNIRYDDPIQFLKFGLSFEPERYTPRKD
ncbi:MAG: hypothetical protein ABIQ93_02080 [Saprospiraceae bacterium]